MADPLSLQIADNYCAYVARKAAWEAKKTKYGENSTEAKEAKMQMQRELASTIASSEAMYDPNYPQ